MEKSEFQLIAELFAPMAESFSGSIGLTDDVGFLPSPKDDILQVATVDAIVEGGHFLPDDPPYTVAQKLLRVSLSDLAAKGAKPYAVMVSAFLNDATDFAWISEFARGLKDDLKQFDCGLLGGDTVRTFGARSFSLTAVGHINKNYLPLRKNAKNGDLLFVSGSLGDAALGLEALTGKLLNLEQEDYEYLVERYRVPLPRLALGREIAPLINASMDISDGLGADLTHICELSNLAADVYADKLPVSVAAKNALEKIDNPYEMFFGGGDDYEILFSVEPINKEAVLAAAKKAETKITEIGRLYNSPKPEVKLLDAQDEEIYLARKGYEHFSK